MTVPFSRRSTVLSWIQLAPIGVWMVRLGGPLALIRIAQFDGSGVPST